MASQARRTGSSRPARAAAYTTNTPAPALTSDPSSPRPARAASSSPSRRWSRVRRLARYRGRKTATIAAVATQSAAVVSGSNAGWKTSAPR